MQKDINTGNGENAATQIGSADMAAPGKRSAKKREKRILPAQDALQILQGALNECVASGILVKFAPLYSNGAKNQLAIVLDGVIIIGNDLRIADNGKEAK